MWCQYNAEGDLLEQLIPDAVQVKGAQSEEEKERRIVAFLLSSARVLITKAKIAGFGLNLQRAAHVVTFCTHSYESFYQSVRRCWRFGQDKPVTVDIVLTEGETRVMENMVRKAKASAKMFDCLLEHMQRATRIVPGSCNGHRMQLPLWFHNGGDISS